MADVDLNFIAEQLKRVLADTSDLKTRMSPIEHAPLTSNAYTRSKTTGDQAMTYTSQSGDEGSNSNGERASLSMQAQRALDTILLGLLRVAVQGRGAERMPR